MKFPHFQAGTQPSLRRSVRAARENVHCTACFFAFRRRKRISAGSISRLQLRREFSWRADSAAVEATPRRWIRSASIKAIVQTEPYHLHVELDGRRMNVGISGAGDREVGAADLAEAAGKEILASRRPIARERVFDAGADRIAGPGRRRRECRQRRAEQRSAENVAVGLAEVDPGEGGAAARVEQKPVRRVADAATNRRQPVGAGVVRHREEAAGERIVPIAGAPPMASMSASAPRTSPPVCQLKPNWPPPVPPTLVFDPVPAAATCAATADDELLPRWPMLPVHCAGRGTASQPVMVEVKSSRCQSAPALIPT